MNRLGSYLKNKRLIIGFYLAPAIAAFSIALVMMPGIRPQAIDSIANSTADVVIGQPDMNSNLINQAGYQKTLYLPLGVSTDGTRLFVADTVNNRIMIYNSIPTSNNAPASVVVGQPDYLSNSINNGGIGSNTLNIPEDVYSDGTKLFVADCFNNRVLIYNSIPTSNNASADIVIGQQNFTSNASNEGGIGANALYHPVTVFCSGTRLFVSDYGNNRVLIYNNINTLPTTNASADVVIGQPNFITSTQNTGGRGANTFYGPIRICANGTKLYVADSYNARVLIYNTIPTSNNASADAVIGQVDFTSVQGGGTKANTLNYPAALHTDGTKLVLADQDNNRVLIYNNINTIPAANASADAVIGQASFTSNTANNGGVEANTLYNPDGLCGSGTKLFVADRNNHRILIYNNIPTNSNALADLVIGQPDMTSNSVNQTSEAISGNTASLPTGVFKYGSKLFISDQDNNRVLIYNSIPTSNNASPDIVIGQPDMTTNEANNGSISARTLNLPRTVFYDGTRLVIPDYENHRVLIYNSLPTSNYAAADIVIGQPDMTSNTANNEGISAKSLRHPIGVYIYGDKLLVSDNFNSRVLIYNNIPTSNYAAADVVIGQETMTTNTGNKGGLSANSLLHTARMYVLDNKLFLSDYENNRVLIYNSIPTSNYAAADVVIGQPDMASNSANQGGAVSSNTLYRPVGVWTASGRLYIGDQRNNRVLVYNTVPVANNAQADIVIGQPDMTSDSVNQGYSVSSKTLNNPTGLFCDDENLYVCDYSNNRVLIYDITTTKPVISDVKFDGSGYVSGDTIRTIPTITAKLSDTGGVGGIYINNLKITVDTTLYTYASFDASTDSYNATTGIFIFKLKNALSTGTHNVKIEVSDYFANWGTFEANNLKVNDSSGTVQMDGIPLNYPNPFKPLSETTKITYKLTVDSDILIYIFDVRGVLLKKASYSSGSMGGKAGYNEVTWDGKDDFGSTVGNGIYPYRVVSGGRVLGRGKIAVLE